MGNIKRATNCSPEVAVHPHACGEHGCHVQAVQDDNGSSPRLWGTLTRIFEYASMSRFIPTPVGNIEGNREAVYRPPVHPHAYGEHTLQFSGTLTGYGSSPRLWGTFFGIIFSIPMWRFIPTPVGNMPLPEPPQRKLSVHPHACGEHPSPSTGSGMRYGSSPRLWGTYGPYLRDLSRGRFIPTPVGNISTASPIASKPTVHPHACGEHLGDRISENGEFGSSPRLWGTL